MKRGRPKGSRNKTRGPIVNIRFPITMSTLETERKEEGPRGLYKSGSEDSFESIQEIEKKYLEKARVQIEEGSMPTNLTFEDFHQESLRRAEFREKVEGEKRHVEISIETDKPIAIALLSDLHVGSSGIDYELLKQTGEIIKEHPLAYCITAGDITDSLFFSYGDEVLNMQEQYVYMSKMLQWIGAENILAGIVGNHECLDTQTEAFTRNGWKSYKELNMSDEFLTINDKGVCEWKKPDNILIEDFKGKLNSLIGRNIDMLVTDNHKIATEQRRTGKIMRTKAIDFVKKSSLDNNAFIQGGVNKNKPYSIEDCWIRLIAWIMTDGWIGRTSCGISQRKEKAHLPREVLVECGASFSERERTRKVGMILGRMLKVLKPSIDFCIHTKTKRKIAALLDNGKYRLPSWVWLLSKRQFDIFLNTLVDGDGSRKGGNIVCFYQKNKELLDELQGVCVLNGYRTSIYGYRDNQYRLNICERRVTRAVNLKISKKDYDGEVWDITVPNHIFLVRRDGKAYFTGNSWASKTGINNYIEFSNHLQRPLLRGVSFVDLTVGKVPYRLMMAHKFLGSSYINPTHQESRANREIPGADIILAAHTHKPGESVIYQPQYGGGARKVALVNGKTFKKTDSYGKDKGFTPTSGDELGCNWIILNHDKKMVRVCSSNEEMIETMKAYV